MQIFFFFVAFLCIYLPVSVHAQSGAVEPGFHPYISVEEEYNDNINLASTNKKDDYITTVKPGLKYTNMDKVSGVDFDYNLGLVYYGKETDSKYVSHNGSLNVKYLTKEHFNFYLKESFIRSDEQREREYFTTTEENKYVLSTRTERSIYWRNVVAPTIEYQFGPDNRLGLNYRNNIYRTESTVGQDSREDYINPFFDYWFNQKNGIHLEYGYTIGDFNLTPDMTGHRANGRYTNRISPKSSIFAEYTFSQRNFDPPSTDYDIHEPSVGITYAFSPTFNASAQVGYFWKEPEIGEKTDGPSYKASITNLDVRTTYILSLQGGYTEDYFTSENLGFNRYHRLTGSITHYLEKRTSVGFSGNVERAEFDQDRKDWIWGASGTLSHTPLKWLTLALEISHRERTSNIDANDYTENRGIIRITATY
ncbi:MAG: outer membrane beta-barrel protein [Deltaproteobacteria bacterium]|nr:outer membrane beta-barrel protein [Deltaproteobacteria bacterium]